MTSPAGASLQHLALSSQKLAEGKHDDWMAQVNAQSAAQLSAMANQAASRPSSASSIRTRISARDDKLGIDDLKAPLLAAVGAADLALERVNEIVATLRERAGDARTDAEARAEASRARINKLQEELPTQVDDIRRRLTSEELRRFAEGYADAAQTTYNKLIERGEAALEHLRTQPALEEAASRVEGYTDLTQEALGNVATQTRAVGERAAKLVGVELPKRGESLSQPAKRPSKKSPAKKAPTKRAAAGTSRAAKAPRNS